MRFVLVVFYGTHQLDVVDAPLGELLQGPLGALLQREGEALQGLVLAVHADLRLPLQGGGGKRHTEVTFSKRVRRRPPRTGGASPSPSSLHVSAAAAALGFLPRPTETTPSLTSVILILLSSCSASVSGAGPEQDAT